MKKLLIGAVIGVVGYKVCRELRERKRESEANRRIREGIEKGELREVFIPHGETHSMDELTREQEIRRSEGRPPLKFDSDPEDLDHIDRMIEENRKHRDRCFREDILGPYADKKFSTWAEEVIKPKLIEIEKGLNKFSEEQAEKEYVENFLKHVEKEVFFKNHGIKFDKDGNQIS